MRVNVYSQELTGDCKIVTKDGSDGETFPAVSMFLHSSAMLHQPPLYAGKDDDRSAVTFWLPKSTARREDLAQTFEKMARMVRAVDFEDKTPLLSNADGRHPLVQATLAMVRYQLDEGIESSWNDSTESYDAKPFVNLWDLPRSKGYIVVLQQPKLNKQINIAIISMVSTGNIGIIVFESDINDKVSALDCPDVGTPEYSLEEFDGFDFNNASLHIVGTLEGAWRDWTDILNSSE